MCFHMHTHTNIHTTPLSPLTHTQHPSSSSHTQVDTVLGDRKPTVADMRELKYTTRVINEAMRLYPQPPVLIRRALEDDTVGGVCESLCVCVCVYVCVESFQTYYYTYYCTHTHTHTHTYIYT